MVSSNRLIYKWALFSLLGITLWGLPGYAAPDKAPSTAADDLNLEQDLLQRSPVLKRWLDSPPDVLNDIENTPAFPTKFKIGVANVPSRENDYELALGAEDIFLGKSGFTLSAEYRLGRQYPLLPRSPRLLCQFGAPGGIHLAPLRRCRIPRTCTGG
jgi:hypothetical protein